MIHPSSRAALILLLVFFCSCSHSSSWDSIKGTETYIEDHPDSALSVLSAINSSELKSRHEKALHALMLSMAIDKNYIDRTDFDILQPAIDYYDSHGSATEKLRLYYYQGCIYRNIGDDAKAMKCFSEALAEGEGSNDKLTSARTYFAQALINTRLFRWEDCIEEYRKASILFDEGGRPSSSFNCRNRILEAHILTHNEDAARIMIDELTREKDNVDKALWAEFQTQKLSFATSFLRPDAIIQVIHGYISESDDGKVDWMTVARAFREINEYDNALDAISKVDSSKDDSEDSRYFALKSSILEKNGFHEEALAYYRKYVSLNDAEQAAVYFHDTRYAQIEFEHELELANEKTKTALAIALSASLFALLLAVTIWLYSRVRLQKTKIDEYSFVYEKLEQEHERLEELLASNKDIDDSAAKALSDRMSVLNAFLTAAITSNTELDNKAYNEINRLLEDRQSFMASTRMAYSKSNPRFIRHLEEHGLTTQEIELCCLYLIGLRGKEVSSYIKKRSHYDDSILIRSKLGLDSHSTNLGIYLRKLAKELI